tara:strand:+ start:168 stop:281 length:114 start_codon:yes stop_codon:yes gene_type:complete
MVLAVPHLLQPKVLLVVLVPLTLRSIELRVVAVEHPQ